MIKNKSNYPKSFFVGIVLLLLVVILVSAAPLIAGYNPLEQNPEERLQSLSTKHLFGTDRFGRDVFSRTLYGGRVTLISCAVALLSTLIIGLFVGLISGMFKDKAIDIIFMRIIDALMSFPFMVLAMVVVAVFGTSLFHLMVVVVVVWWVPFARMTRSIVLKAKTEKYIDSAIVLGAKNSTIMFRELLPRVIGPILVQATFELGSLILTISALSFLGLGLQPPTPEWGSMLSDGRAHFFQSPHILLGPMIFIIITVLSLNMIGEGLRDHLDPYEISKL